MCVRKMKRPGIIYMGSEDWLSHPLSVSSTGKLQTISKFNKSGASYSTIGPSNLILTQKPIRYILYTLFFKSQLNCQQNKISNNCTQKNISNPRLKTVAPVKVTSAKKVVSFPPVLHSSFKASHYPVFHLSCIHIFPLFLRTQASNSEEKMLRTFGSKIFAKIRKMRLTKILQKKEQAKEQKNRNFSLFSRNSSSRYSNN